MVCVCRTQVLAMARPAADFPSMSRGLMRSVPIAEPRARADRLCSRGLLRLPAAHVLIEPEGATTPAGETDGNDVPGGGTGEPAGFTDPAGAQPGADSAVKPAASTLKTTTTTAKTTVTVNKALNSKSCKRGSNALKLCSA